MIAHRCLMLQRPSSAPLQTLSKHGRIGHRSGLKFADKMTDKNHRRRNKPPVNQRHRPEYYRNGRAPVEGKGASSGHVGKTDYLDKSQMTWNGEASLSGKRFSAHISNDFTNGHRGMARAVAGAQKFVRSRIRFHENAEVRRLAKGPASDE